MAFKAFKKIGQYKDIIKNLILQEQFVGKDDEDRPIYDKNVDLPKVMFRGTCKLHGSNAGVHFNSITGELTPQKRSSSLGGEHGHFGFVEYIRSNEDYFKEILNGLCEKAGCESVTLFGEWCGEGIQKKVAISELPKRFVVFEAWCPEKEEYLSYELISHISNKERKLYNVNDYQTYEIEVDLKFPQSSADEINKLIDKVEKVCPISKAMLLDEFPDKCVDREEYLGEGIVFKSDSGAWFKAKGDKHSKSNSGGKKATIDPIKAKSIQEFVEKTVTEDRLQQCYDEIASNNGGEVTSKNIGDLMKWIFNDIITEEGDALQHNNLDKKDIGSTVANVARPWFMWRINKFFYNEELREEESYDVSVSI